MELGEHDVYRPDVAGWRRERLPELPAEAVVAVRPDWVCEILSPSNTRNDLLKKLRIYQRSGVPHQSAGFSGDQRGHADRERLEVAELVVQRVGHPREIDRTVLVCDDVAHPAPTLEAPREVAVDHLAVRQHAKHLPVRRWYRQAPLRNDVLTEINRPLHSAIEREEDHVLGIYLGQQALPRNLPPIPIEHGKRLTQRLQQGQAAVRIRHEPTRFPASRSAEARSARR